MQLESNGSGILVSAKVEGMERDSGLAQAEGKRVAGPLLGLMSSRQGYQEE